MAWPFHLFCHSPPVSPMKSVPDFQNSGPDFQISRFRGIHHVANFEFEVSFSLSSYTLLFVVLVPHVYPTELAAEEQT